jgi:hypothetical protein
MGCYAGEMLHRFRAVKNAKAAHRWISTVFQVENTFEGKLCKAGGIESGKFSAGERPGHLAFRVGRFAAASDDEEETTRAKEFDNFFDGARAQGDWQNL